jgi:choline dehydrogenase-like flavoprotein
MFLDFRTVTDQALIEADLCIVGAGAAGLTMARALAGSRVQVCLVEAGAWNLSQTCKMSTLAPTSAIHTQIWM